MGGAVVPYPYKQYLVRGTGDQFIDCLIHELYLGCFFLPLKILEINAVCRGIFVSQMVLIIVITVALLIGLFKLSDNL